jgi:hypothetical protein
MTAGTSEAVQGSEDEDSDAFDEEVTPERLLEIKAILFDIYSKYSQEKLNKIDRLLAKYVTHEEEFLRFVFNKYSVDPALYKSQLKKKSAPPSPTRGSSPVPPDAANGTDGTEGTNGAAAEESASSPDGVEASRPTTSEGIAQSQDGEEDGEGGNETAEESANEAPDGLQIDTSAAASGSLTARSTGGGSGPKTDSAPANRNQARDVRPSVNVHCVLYKWC